MSARLQLNIKEMISQERIAKKSTPASKGRAAIAGRWDSMGNNGGIDQSITHVQYKNRKKNKQKDPVKTLAILKSIDPFLTQP